MSNNLVSMTNDDEFKNFEDAFNENSEAFKGGTLIDVKIVGKMPENMLSKTFEFIGSNGKRYTFNKRDFNGVIIRGYFTSFSSDTFTIYDLFKKTDRTFQKNDVQIKIIKNNYITFHQR